ncbi:MAG: pyruvate kinase [Deltaproteobacteria bacterium]|nr:pyruvate kinase [Deltaproteobacteria bacterium]
MRRTKIVCTLGPASCSPGVIRQLIEAGMDVARLNFSHGTPEEHRELVRLIRRWMERLGRPVAILQDLRGPKIRLGLLQAPTLMVAPGDHMTLTTRPVRGRAGLLPVSHPGLPGEVHRGDPILLGDGLIRLEVLGVRGTDVRCHVIQGGAVRAHQGVNLPNAKVRLGALTPKDRRDLALGLALGVDFVALSFVRAAADIEQARRLIRRRGAEVPLVAKLEKPQALEALDAILHAADGVMVARGDLGVELPPEKVPALQKRIISQANRQGVCVITATEMLESMIHQPRPTRAEASDVANAVLDGTDAVMLSAETATGEHPVEAVRFMARIVEEAEALLAACPVAPCENATIPFPEAVSQAAALAASWAGARAIVAFTQSGATARAVARYRPHVPVIALTPSEATWRRLALCWGVLPRRVRMLGSTDEMIRTVDRELRQAGVVARGEPVVIVAGTPLGHPGRTNLLTLHRVGDPV